MVRCSGMVCFIADIQSTAVLIPILEITVPIILHAQDGCNGHSSEGHYCNNHSKIKDGLRLTLVNSITCYSLFNGPCFRQLSFIWTYYNMKMKMKGKMKKIVLKIKYSIRIDKPKFVSVFASLAATFRSKTSCETALGYHLPHCYDLHQSWMPHGRRFI